MSDDGIKKKHHPGTKGTDAMNKLSQDQRREYRQQVYEVHDEMIGKGMTYTERFKALARHFQVSEQMGKNYIGWYKEDRKKLREEMVIDSREDAIAQYDYLYKEAMRKGERKEARECLAEKIKLMGLAAPKRTESLNVTQVAQAPDYDFSRFTTEQLKGIHDAQQALRLALTGSNPQIIQLPPTEDAA